MTKEARKIAEKFQRDMVKLGLGVKFWTDDSPPVTVTTWCASCNHVSTGAPERCPKCGASLARIGAE